MPRFLINSLLVVVAIIGIAGLASGDDKSDRERRAKAAVAVAKALGEQLPSVAIAPAPHKPEPKNYATGGKEAMLDQSPLVVYVGCDGPKIDGAITCFVSAQTFGDAVAPAVVVGYPLGEKLVIEKTLPCPAPGDKAGKAAIDKAVENAARKIDKPPAKQMPSLPKPLDTQIRKTGCDSCGDACACKHGECPAQCPVAASPATTVVVAAPVQPTCRTEYFYGADGRLYQRTVCNKR